MAEVGIRALKQNASAVVAQVVAGEVVTVTDRGREVAVIVPLDRPPLAQLGHEGRLRVARQHLSDLKPATSGPALSAVLLDDRDDARY